VASPRSVGVVAAVTVSGLNSDEDHAFIVDALTTFLEPNSKNPQRADDSED
jgi:uncharacterized protein (UPF0303 family)